MIGQTINNYVLERKLGEGGMGNVYFARHNRIDRVVAIKVLHKNLFANENIRTRFKNEANALIKLGHPNIVKIYDYVEQEEFACLIMEYIEGFTLDDYINKITGPLPGPRATHIICSVLDAVQYAHDNNIFHRDIKPGNIMVSKDGKSIRIMDFSIAKFADPGNLKTTHANAQLGTPFYMSPEQVKGMAYTALSDIYSLGVTLFEMVTGKCPYQEITNLFELQSKIVNEPLPPTGKYYPNVTGKLQDAIIIATKKDPEQRFKSCSEFKTYLAEEEKKPVVIIPVPVSKPAIRKISLEPTKPEPVYIPDFFEEKKKNKTRAYIIGVLSVVAICVIVIAFIKKGGGPPPPPPPGEEKIINDIVGKKLSSGLIFSVKDTANIIQRPGFDTECKCATLVYKNANSDSSFQVKIQYAIIDNEYVYEENNCIAIENTKPPPGPNNKGDNNLPFLDFSRVYQDIKANNLSNNRFIARYYIGTFQTQNEGKYRCARFRYNAINDDSTLYEVKVFYEPVDKGYVYSYNDNNIIVINHKKTKLPTSSMKDTASKGGNTITIPPPPPQAAPEIPKPNKIVADFNSNMNKYGITHDVTYTDKPAITEGNIEYKPIYENKGKQNERVNFIISFNYHGVSCKSKIVYKKKGDKYGYVTINPQ